MTADDDKTRVHGPGGFPSVGGEAHRHEHADGHAHDPAGEHVHEHTTSAPLPPYEPVHRPVSVGATSSPTPVGGRNSRWRWVAAAVATLVVVALVGGFLVFLGPRPGTPSLVSLYAPVDVPAYAEVRLDLPGDQHDRLAEFMSHFPGFADPATFDQKINDTLQQALSRSGMGLDWNNDIKPWFGGQVGIFSATINPPVGTPPSMTLVFSVKDKAKLDELVNARVAEAGSAMQQEDYKGQTIWSGTATDAARRISLAVTDEAFLVSTRSDDLKQALDVKSGAQAGLAKDAFVSQQLGALHSDRLAAFYYDYASALDNLPSGLSGLPAGCLEEMTNAARIKMIGEVRAEDDHLAVTMRSQIPTGANIPAAPGNKRSVLLSVMPPSTVAYLEARQVGAGIDAVISQLLSCVGGTQAGFDPRQIEQLLGTPLDTYFDFLSDAGIAVTSEDGRFGAGLIATVDDQGVAATRVERLLSAVRLMALGGGVTINEEQHGEATLTVITFDAGSVIPDQDIPSVALTVSGGRLYIGLDDFVVDALDRAEADSLGASPRLQAALAAAGAENAGLAYIDITALRAFAESSMPADARQQYDTEAKPFIEPVSHLVLVNRTDGSMNVANVFLYVE
jgi:hypothetical protein